MRFFCFLLVLVFSCSCMSDKEYQLRRLQLKNQKNHKSHFDVLTLEGGIKVEILEGGKVTVRAPNQPFQIIDIPDGVKNQVDLVSHLISIGAITFIGDRALKKSGNKTKIINSGE